MNGKIIKRISLLSLFGWAPFSWHFIDKFFTREQLRDIAKEHGWRRGRNKRDTAEILSNNKHRWMDDYEVTVRRVKRKRQSYKRYPANRRAF